MTLHNAYNDSEHEPGGDLESAATSFLDAPEEEPSRSGGFTLALLALVIPIAITVVRCLKPFDPVSWYLMYGTVAVTAILLAIDAALIRRSDSRHNEYTSGIVVMLAVGLVWAFGFPLAYSLRKGVRDPNLFLASIVVMIGFLFGPTLFLYAVPPELPTADSAAVRHALEQMADDTFAIDTVREVRYDEKAQLRIGHLTATSDGDTEPLRFEVRWRAKARDTFEVQLFPLPDCTAKEILNVLEQIIREQIPQESELVISDLEEIEIDLLAGTKRCSGALSVDGASQRFTFEIGFAMKPSDGFTVQIIESTPIEDSVITL